MTVSPQQIARLKSWKPGQSGNPLGRRLENNPARQLARQHGPEAIEKLVELMRHSRDEKVQCVAAMALLDRGYGKPKPVVEDENLQVVRLSEEERVAMLQELANRMGYKFEKGE